jgi:hypothetical protein
MTSRTHRTDRATPRGILGAFALLAPLALGGWGAAGHRDITRAAIAALPAGTPEWLREPGFVERAAFLANEPDRWRATRLDALTHENGPDHYIDLEELPPRKMDLRTLPPLRYEFVAMLERRMPTPDAANGSEPARRGIGGAQGGDTRPATDQVGTLPYAIVEQHAKLASAFRTVRILDAINDPARAAERDAALGSVATALGHLSHFVGDASQPLHTTIHHHGWVRDNPAGYTTNGSIHARIDSDVPRHHKIDAEALSALVKPIDATEPPVGPTRAWEAALSEIERSFAQVEPLYQLEKQGLLEAEQGRAFITERMADGARTLAELVHSAWLASEPTKDQIESFIRYDETRATGD